MSNWEETWEKTQDALERHPLADLNPCGKAGRGSCGKIHLGLAAQAVAPASQLLDHDR